MSNRTPDRSGRPAGARTPLPGLVGLWLVLAVPTGRQIGLLDHDWADAYGLPMFAAIAAIGALATVIVPVSGPLALAVLVALEAYALRHVSPLTVILLLGSQAVLGIVAVSLSRRYRPIVGPPRTAALAAAVPAFIAASVTSVRAGLAVPAALALLAALLWGLGAAFRARAESLARPLAPIIVALDAVGAWLDRVLVDLVTRPLGPVPAPSTVGPSWDAQTARSQPPLGPPPILVALGVGLVVLIDRADQIHGLSGSSLVLAGTVVAVSAMLHRRTALPLSAAAVALLLASGLRAFDAVVLVAVVALWCLALGIGTWRASDRWSGRLTLWPTTVVLLATVAPWVLAPIDARPEPITVGLVVLAAVTLLPAVHRRLVTVAEASAPLRTPVVRAVHRVARALGRLVGAIAMVPVAVVFCTSWVFHRLCSVDVMDSPAGTTRWAERRGADPDARRAFAAVPMTSTRPPRALVGRTLAGLATATALIVVVIALPRAPGQVIEIVRPKPPVDPYAIAGPPPGMFDRGESEIQQIRTETAYVAGRVRYDPHTAHTTRDYVGRYITLIDGRRRIWTPPPCSCRRLTVWWFGGSAAWGFYQRDDLSFPAQLAQLAWKEGIALDIEVYASPGMTIGQEVQRFAHLSVTQPPPDLVVTYDGANELQQQLERNDRNQGDDPSTVSSFERKLDTLLRTFTYPDPETGGDLPPLTEFHRVPDREWVDVAMTRYEQDLTLFRRLAESIDAPLLAYWQPLYPLAPEVTAKPSVEVDDLERWTAILEQARAAIPEGVIDLSSAFDEVDRPTFEDKVHTDEYGAGITAAAVWETLEPVARAASG